MICYRQYIKALIVFVLLIGALGGLYTLVDDSKKIAITKYKSYQFIPVRSEIHLPKVEFNNGRSGSVILHEDQQYKVVRDILNGYVSVFYKETDANNFIKIAMDLGWAKNTYPMAVIKGTEQDLYVIGYDVVNSTPSGKRLSGVSNTFGLTFFKSGRVQEIISLEEIGGIDDVLYSSYSGGNLHVCAVNKCLTVSRDAEIRRWPLNYLSDYEFIEVSFEGDKAAALVRKKYDDRANGKLTEEYSDYYITVFDKNGEVRPLSKTMDIPYKLHWNNGEVGYQEARTPEDLLDVFLFDISRMPVNGVMEFGANNLEGRIAWRQVYYLHGMISLLSGQIENLPLSEAQRAMVTKRTKQELSFIRKLCVTKYPGFLVKRYSLDREPLLFALHLGRISSLLARARSEGLIGGDECTNKLVGQMLALDETVEKLEKAEDGNFKYFAYRYGYPFWADGANVPYNFISGIVDGILSNINTGEHFIKVSRLMRPLIENELKGEIKPWRYWYGRGDSGWDANMNVSLNTPEYVGNKKSVAHITYRSIDAKAVLRVEKNNPESELIMKVRKMVEDGIVLPDVNEYLYEFGGVAYIDSLAAKRYSRSSTAWQLESQVWALDQLGKDD